MDIIFEGPLETDGSTKIVCSTDSLVINTIIINNFDDPYVITMNIFIATPGVNNEAPIYEFTLDAGDSVRDVSEYTLFRGSYLQLVSSVPGTTYYINGVQS